MIDIDKFFKDQFSIWHLAAKNFRALKELKSKTVPFNGLNISVQYNPARIISSAAKTDTKSLQSRPCFLCRTNRTPEQRSIDFEGRKGRKYDILVNPYPIFSSHLLISSVEHTSQAIWKRFVDILDLAYNLNDFTIFYNGPQAGASAPDHFHFQACHQKQLPLEVEIDDLLDRKQNTEIEELEYITSVKDASLEHYKKYIRGVFVLHAKTSKSMAKLFYRLIDSCSSDVPGCEPKFNLFVWYTSGKAASPEYRAIVIFRNCHRPHFYYEIGENHMNVSPGCADMAGIFIAPTLDDYNKLTTSRIGEILDEVSINIEKEMQIISRLTRKQRIINVKIMSSKEICFEIISDGAGMQKVSFDKGKINYNGVLYDELVFEAKTLSTLFSEPSFKLYDVLVGKDSNNGKNLIQRFAGTLKFITDGENVVAINMVGIEDYVLSIISSERKPTDSLEYLKYQAIVTRTWILSADYDIFEVCPDNHFLCYRGLEETVNKQLIEAVDRTWGEVL